MVATVISSTGPITLRGDLRTLSVVLKMSGTPASKPGCAVPLVAVHERLDLNIEVEVMVPRIRLVSKPRKGEDSAHWFYVISSAASLIVNSLERRALFDMVSRERKYLDISRALLMGLNGGDLATTVGEEARVLAIPAQNTIDLISQWA